MASADVLKPFGLFASSWETDMEVWATEISGRAPSFQHLLDEATYNILCWSGCCWHMRTQKYSSNTLVQGFLLTRILDFVKELLCGIYIHTIRSRLRGSPTFSVSKPHTLSKRTNMWKRTNGVSERQGKALFAVRSGRPSPSI